MATTTLTYLIEMKTRAAKSATEGLGKEAKKTGNALEGASKSAGDLNKESKSAAKSVRRLSGQLRGVGSALRPLSATAGQSGRALSALTGGIGALAVAGGPATAAIAVLAGGLIAGGVAVAGFSKAVIGAIGDARALNEQLSSIPAIESIFTPVPDSTLNSFEQLSQAGAALSTIVDAIALSFAVEFQPQIEAATLFVVGLGFAVADFSKKAMQSLGAVFSVVNSIPEGVMTAFGTFGGPLAAMAQGAAAVSRQIGEVNEALELGNVTADSYIGRAQSLLGTLQLQAVETEKTTDKIDKQRNAVEELTLSLIALGDAGQIEINLEGARAGIAEAQESLSDLESQLDALISSEEQRIAEKPINVGTGLSAAGAVAGGDITGLLSMAGPVGMGAGALVAGLSTLGEEGAEGIGDQLDDLSDNLLKGIKELPKLLTEILPEFAYVLALELPIAIIKAIPALVAGLADMLNPFDDLAQSSKFQAKYADQIAALQSAGILEPDSRDKGGSIGRPGFYFLHPGEEVIRNNGTSSQRAESKRSNQSGAVRIQLRSPSIFPFLYEMDRITGAGGLRESY